MGFASFSGSAREISGAFGGSGASGGLRGPPGASGSLGGLLGACGALDAGFGSGFRVFFGLPP